MHDTAFAKEDAWMQIVGPLSARLVMDTVSPVIGDSVSLRPEAPGLARIVAPALEELGIAHGGIRILSESAPGEFLRELPENARRFAALRPNDELARAIDWRLDVRLDELLDRALSPVMAVEVDRERAARLKGRLWIEIFRRPNTDARNGLGELGGMILQSRFAVAYHLAAFVMARRVQRQPPLRTLLGLIRAGNVPLGTLQDGTFLVVTS